MNREAIRVRLEQGREEQVFPGAVVGVLHADGSRTIVPIGRFTYESASREVRSDTQYDVASITKAVPVGLLALSFIDQGRLGLDEQVIRYIPEITIEGRETTLIRHLLTYTYVLEKNPDPNFSYENYKAQDVFDFLYHRPFAFPPGTRYQYSNTPANLLGIILERISGKKLYALAQELVLEPLRMSHSTFRPAMKDTIPPTEITPWRGEIQGVVHDETSFILQREGFDAGCAGLFSTADDLLNVAEMMLDGGTFKGAKILSPETVSLAAANALTSIGASSGIGWELNQPAFMGSYSDEHMIGKTGFTGTCIIIGQRQKKALVLLSNRTYPQRGDVGGIASVRRDISDIVFAP
jgi:CubicO group peptidase (beta-lactamase class C family)